MRRALLLLLLPAALAGQRLTVAVGLQDYLGHVADTATIEHHICLFADKALSAQGDTIFVLNNGIWPPQAATQDNVVAVTCPDSAFAAWHNHIRARAEVALTKYAIRVPKATTGDARACYLSSLDFISTLREPVRMQIVQVNYRTFCWWTKRAIQAQYRRSAPVYGIPIVTWPTHIRTEWGQDRRERP